jgi:soluble lytic murein transglycosylase-like protein
MYKRLLKILLLISIIATSIATNMPLIDVQYLNNSDLDTPHLIFANKEQANVWLTDMSNRLAKWMPNKLLRQKYLTIIQYEAKRAHLDPQLILAIITVESKFQQMAISNSGAVGIMQIMPFWIAQLNDTLTHNLFDVQTNIRYGCMILNFYLQTNNGNIYRALAAYNGSVDNVWYPYLVMNAYNKYWQPATLVTLKNNNLELVNYYN